MAGEEIEQKVKNKEEKKEERGIKGGMRWSEDESRPLAGRLETGAQGRARAGRQRPLPEGWRIWAVGAEKRIQVEAVREAVTKFQLQAAATCERERAAPVSTSRHTVAADENIPNLPAFASKNSTKSLSLVENRSEVII